MLFPMSLTGVAQSWYASLDISRGSYRPKGVGAIGSFLQRRLPKS